VALTASTAMGTEFLVPGTRVYETRALTAPEPSGSFLNVVRGGVWWAYALRKRRLL